MVLLLVGEPLLPKGHRLLGRRRQSRSSERWKLRESPQREGVETSSDYKDIIPWAVW